jgi:predicted DsbA family dithiol-disulfide isomerase
LKQEFSITEGWLPFEIHPDTPQEGVLFSDYFPGMDPVGFFRQLDARGRDMGVRFGPQMLMSNSREALEAGEFAREHGRHGAYHEAIFQAYFTECKDIGRREVILDAARSVALDAEQLNAALEAMIYHSRLKETTRMAGKNQIRAAPTFLIEGYGSITGAQPIETFRTALREVQKKEGKQENVQVHL